MRNETAMTDEFKTQCVTLAREIQEALTTLEVAADPSSEERERIEAKNVVANVLRSYKNLIENLSGTDKTEASKLLHKKIEDMALKAKYLR